MITFGISTPFGMLSPTKGQVAYALLTRSPLRVSNTENLPVSPARMCCHTINSVVKAPLSPLGVTLKILSVRNSPFDLHVLGMPPAFVLSQDQTLQ